MAIFWHIPWPNPEAFGICPWQRELLDGMLGADLIGFHIQAHCNNFLETVDRALESRIDWEHFAVNRGDHLTAVRPFPISVAFERREPTASRRGRIVRSARPAARELGVQARLSWAWVWIASTTPREFRSVCAESSGFFEMYPATGRSSPSCRSARPAARTSSAIRI